MNNDVGSVLAVNDSGLSECPERIMPEHSTTVATSDRNVSLLNVNFVNLPIYKAMALGCHFSLFSTQSLSAGDMFPWLR